MALIIYPAAPLKWVQVVIAVVGEVEWAVQAQHPVVRWPGDADVIAGLAAAHVRPNAWRIAAVTWSASLRRPYFSAT